MSINFNFNQYFEHSSNLELWNKYQPRLTNFSDDNSFYNSTLNVFSRCGYGIPNCTAYAWGRFYEISKQAIGELVYPKLSTSNAEDWFTYVRDGYTRSPLYAPENRKVKWNSNRDWRITRWINYGYDTSKNIEDFIPQVGAIIVYGGGIVGESSPGGHVVIIEQINAVKDSEGNIVDIQLIVSQSGYQGTRFWTRDDIYLSKNYEYSPDREFMGFIYHPNYPPIEGFAQHINFKESIFTSSAGKRTKEEVIGETEVSINLDELFTDFDDSEKLIQLGLNYSFGFAEGLYRYGDNPGIEKDDFSVQIQLSFGENFEIIINQMNGLHFNEIITIQKDLKINKDDDNFFIEMTKIEVPEDNKLKLKLQFIITATTSISETELEDYTFELNVYNLSLQAELPNYDTYKDFLNTLLGSNNTGKGIFKRDGELFINASMIATGVIMSENWVASGGTISPYGTIEQGGTEGTAFDLTNGEINTTSLTIQGENSYSLSLDKEFGLLLKGPNGQELLKANNDGLFLQDEDYEINSSKASNETLYYYKIGYIKSSGAGEYVNVRSLPNDNSSTIVGGIPQFDETKRQLWVECDSNGKIKQSNGYYYIRDYKYDVNGKSLISGWVASRFIVNIEAGKNSYPPEGNAAIMTLAAGDEDNAKYMKIDVSDKKQIIIGNGSNRIIIGGDDTYALQIGNKFKLDWEGNINPNETN